MSKEKYFKAAMYIASIGMLVDNANYEKIKDYLSDLTKILEGECADDIEAVAAEICDTYCRFPYSMAEDITDVCNKCPLNKLLK